MGLPVERKQEQKTNGVTSSPFLRALLRNDQMTVMTNNKVQAIQHPRTLRKNSGNGSFADILATISVNFIESGAHQNQPDFGNTPDQA
jgi:ABC-type sugar transport system ATPase subunit